MSRFVLDRLAFVLLAGLTVAQPLPAVEFHVAPQGRDQNPGTAAAPFGTLARAQQAVRQAKQAGKLAGPVNVLIHGGVYQPAEPLVFEAQDSGTAAAPITYQGVAGQQVVFRGGQAIGGWKKFNDHLWAAEIADVKAGRWHFRQLFVGGEGRPRARTPNQGFFRVTSMPDGGHKVPYHTKSQRFGFKPGDLRPDWTNLEDVEVIVYHFWTDSHLPIRSIDPATNIVTFAHPTSKVFTDDFTPGGARYVAENVFEALDQPGEWYLNRKTGVLYYWPKPGEDMARVEVVAPRLPAFIHLRAEPTKLSFVEHLTFRNLTFEYCNFELKPGDANDHQASDTVAAAITLTGVRHCRIENCTLKNLGTYAVEIGRGCSENAFTGNELAHLAAGGFRINGGTEGSHPLDRTWGNVISDNHLHHYGEVFPSAVGVLLMHAEGNAVLHNHIHHGWYTGISAGWVWGYGRSISRDNRLEFNHIHTIGQGLLSDMGGIYTLGVSPGTTVRNNLIHDVDANQYGGWGIYHDEGSTHLLVENNVVYNTKFAPFNIHYAKEVTVRNNIFALGRLEQLSRGRNEPHKSVYFERNIVFWREGKLYSQNWKDVPYEFHINPTHTAKHGLAKMTSTFECDWNLYFNPTLKLDEVKFAGATWAEWHKRGKDLHSQYADPRFVDVDRADFRLQPDSPAWALGFQPIDLSQVGPRGACGAGR
jgi:hypothetical protein